jgi:hypothetical protein
VALVLFLCGIVCILFLRWHWRHEFHRRVEAIRAAGYPVTPKEHDAWYKWPQSDDNAANWILGAAAMYQEPPKEDWERLHRIISPQDTERPHPAEPLAADLRALLEQYIQTNAMSLKSLHEASAIDECRYPMDLSNGSHTVLSHLSGVRNGVLLLCLEAVLHTEWGDPNGAVQAIATALHVADSLDDEPVVISHLVRIASLRFVAVTLERVMSQVALTDRQIETLYRVFHDLDITGGLPRALAGERCMLYPLFDRPQSLDRRGFAKLPPGPLLEAYSVLGLAAREGAVYLDFAQECMQIAQLPVSHYRAAVDAAEIRYLRDRKGILLSRIGLSSGIMGREAVYVASLEVARVALVIERYRLAHGGLPERLDQLVPGDLKAVPEDPFDGKPLRYRRLDRGYVVYSVGEDGKDDGGKEQPPKDSRTPGETWDLVFQVRR